jgi:signal transduction histidine kinase
MDSTAVSSGSPAASTLDVRMEQATSGPEAKRLTTALLRRNPAELHEWARAHWQVLFGGMVFFPVMLADFKWGVGASIAPFYAAPVVLSLWSEKPKYSIFFGYLATFLIVIGFLGNPVVGGTNMDTLQRLGGVALVWLSASLSVNRWQHGRTLERGYLEMEQVVAERTAELVKVNSNLKTEIEERLQAESSLRQLSGHLMTAQDQERRRIARELHDNSGQSLAAIAMNLTRIEHQLVDPSRKMLDLVEDTSVLAEQTSREIRTLSYLLHPPLLEESGLVAAIHWFAKGFTQRSHIETKVTVSADFKRLDQDIEMTLFRIVQESLTNISRHSGSPSARIHLQHNPGEVVLRVEDDGCGISPEKIERVHGNLGALGVGVAGIWERVKLIKGELELISNSSGTILVVLPITENES